MNILNNKGTKIESWRIPLCRISCITGFSKIMMTSSNGNIFRITGHLCGLNNREAGDLRRYRAHYDVTVMFYLDSMCLWCYPSLRVVYFGKTIERLRWIHKENTGDSFFIQCGLAFRNVVAFRGFILLRANDTCCTCLVRTEYTPQRKFWTTGWSLRLSNSTRAVIVIHFTYLSIVT